MDMERSRHGEYEDKAVSFADLYYEPKHHGIFCNKKDLGLTVTELSLLKYMIQSAGSAVSRDELLNNANLIMIKAMKNLENFDEIKLAISASEIILNSSGINGMIYGQFLDLENNAENLTDIEKINSLKTGELFKAAILSGAKLGGANDNDLAHLEIYAKNLGLVFQLQDDLFDYDEDIELNKKTFATVLGKSEVEKARRGEAVLQDTTWFGSGTDENAQVFDRTLRTMEA